MTNLFLGNIFQRNPKVNDSPSAIFITMPNRPNNSSCPPDIIVGLMNGDPTWTVGNKWGPIINDLSNLQDWASLIGSQSQFSWINASTMCWKGTNPIGISADFFLINYDPSLNLEVQLANLTKLAAIEKGEYGRGLGNFIVNVHGGYAADVLSGNNKVFTDANGIRDLLKGKGGGAVSDALNNIGSRLYSDKGDAVGSVSVRFGHKVTIRNLLVSKVNVTQSTVEVMDKNGGNIKPLYYRVSVQFTGVRPLITADVDSMFGIPSGTPTQADPSPVSGSSPSAMEVTRQEAEKHPVLSKVLPSYQVGVFAGAALGSFVKWVRGN